MSKQIIAAVAVVAALLAAYVFLTEPEPQREAGASWTIPEIESFDRIDLRRSDETLVMERVTDGWRLTEPLDFRARARQIERVEDLFADSENRLLVDNEKEATPGNLTRYGFDDDDVLHVTLYDAGQSVATFAVGDTEEDQTNRVRTWVQPENDERLYRLNSDLRAALDHGLEDWRDNEVLALSREERDLIDAVDIAYPNRDIRLEREDDGWAMVEPGDVTIDPDLVTRWVRQIDRLRAADFADGVSDAEAGLERPEHSITLHMGDDSSRQLAIGAVFAAPSEDDEATREERRYVRLDDGPIFVVSVRDAERFMKRTGDFRPRSVLELERDSVVRVDLVDAENRLILVRDALPEDAAEDVEATWQMQESAADDAAVSSRALEPVDTTEMRRVLTAVSEVEALRFDDEIGANAAGFVAPRRTIVIRLADETEHVLAIGAPVEAVGEDETERDVDHFARVDDGLVFVLRDFKVRNLLGTADDLRPEDEADENPEEDNG